MACRYVCTGCRSNPLLFSLALKSPATTRIPNIRAGNAHATTLLRQSLRRNVQSQAFEPLRPPKPEDLPKPRPKKPTKKRRWPRRLLILSAVLGTVYVLDNTFNASALSRSFKTFRTGFVIALDYKLNFRPQPLTGGTITDLHNRNAKRIFDLLHSNGGLYLKIGQAIAMQSAILPPEFQKMFMKMFDDAPQNSWANVEKVVNEDFGKSVEEVFGVSFHGDQSKGVMERRARASASVAQVHWARLADGREVAIKIQKREIAKQVGWDLWAFKVVSKLYTYYFDLPFYSLVPYVSERLLLEIDFENEASNASKMRDLIQGEPRLRDKVYIPKVYPELSSKRVMTAEWIEGIRLWDKDGISRPWKGGWHQGSPGADRRPLPPLAPEAVHNIPTNDPNAEKLKPERSQWRGPDGTGGLGLSLKSVMQIMVDLFSAQMFLFGTVHCDPHPGNIFIRRKPNGSPELVLIDHGLYIQMSPKFRHEYATLWKSLIAFDNAEIKRVVGEWGIGNADIFASATLMRPYNGGDGTTREKMMKDLKGKTESERAYEMQQKMRAGIKQILQDRDKFPQELLFIGRNLRIVQGNNQFLGSPVNRIKITGLWASRALAESPDLSWSERLVNWGRHARFRVVLLGTDAVWWWARLRQMAGLGGGMDEELEGQMKKMAKGMGVELNHGVFEG